MGKVTQNKNVTQNRSPNKPKNMNISKYRQYFDSFIVHMLLLFQISAALLEGKHFLQGGAYFSFGTVRCGAYLRPDAN